MVTDNSVVSYAAFFEMFTPNYEGTNEHELVEFTRNYAKRMLYLWHMYKPDKTFVVKDCAGKIWRDDILNDYYYEHAKAWECMKAAQGKHKVKVLMFDGKHYHVRYKPAKKKWERDSRPIKKADVEAMFLERFENNDYVLQPCELDDVFQFTPHYKGNRKDKAWNANTPKAHYKSHSNRIADSFAPHIGAITLQQDKIEADDLAYMIRLAYPDDEIIYITNDSDWQQMGVKYDSKFYDPSAHKFHNYFSAVYLDELWKKLLGGDGSDGVPGCYINDGARPLGDAAAKKKVNEVGADNMLEFMRENADPVTFKRNLTLISLKAGYKFLKSGTFDITGLEDDIRNKKPPAKPSESLKKVFGITEALRYRQKAQAQEDRKIYYYKKRSEKPTK